MPLTTLGQETRWAYSTPPPSPHGAFSVEDRSSFCAAIDWLYEIRQEATGIEHQPAYLLTHLLTYYQSCSPRDRHSAVLVLKHWSRLITDLYWLLLTSHWSRYSDRSGVCVSVYVSLFRHVSSRIFRDAGCMYPNGNFTAK